VGAPLTFEFVVPASIAGGTEVLVVRRSEGPDGVVLAYDLAAASFALEPPSVRIPRRLHLATKVRSRVVAVWVLGRISPKCIGLIHEGRDYRGDAAGIARLIEEAAAGFGQRAFSLTIPLSPSGPETPPAMEDAP
jgi:hypothetical protein